jgi:hypothetical protein
MWCALRRSVLVGVACCAAPPPVLLSPPAGVQIGGCELWSGSTCWSAAGGALKVVAPAASDAAVWFDGEEITSAVGATGARIAVVDPARPGTLEVRTADGAWAVTVASQPEGSGAPPTDAASRLQAALAQGLVVQASARALVEQEVRGPGESVAPDQIAEVLREALGLVSAFEAAGWRLEVGKPLVAVARSFTKLRFGAPFGAVLRDAVDALGDPRIEARARLLWLDAVLAEGRGATSEALRSYEAAAALYELVTPVAALRTRMQVLDQLDVIGDHAGVAGLFLRTLEAANAAPAGRSDCAREELLSGLVYLWVRARAAGEPLAVERPVEPHAVLDEALRTLDAGAECAGPVTVGVAVHRAMLQLEDGRFADAGATLAALPGELLSVDLARDVALTAAEIALAEGRAADALRLFEGAELRAAGADPSRGGLLALSGQARALAALGRVDEAVVRYRRAHGVAGVYARLVSIGGGRDSFLSAWQRLARDWVVMLVDADRPAEALDALRDVRGALLDLVVCARRQEEQSDADRARSEAAVAAYLTARRRIAHLSSTAWSRPVSEADAIARESLRLREEAERAFDAALPCGSTAGAGVRRAVADGEALLAWLETGHGLYTFVRTTTSTRVFGPVPVPSRGAPPEAWLTAVPLDALAARRWIVLPSGAARDVDLQAAIWGGEPVFRAHELVWSLDLPVRAASTAHTGCAVVADPTGDLPGALAEGERVAAALRARGCDGELIAGRAASRDRIGALRGGLQLLHYAGHGESGARMLDAQLRLSDGEGWGTADVLTTPDVPARVVLSGCETARTGASEVESLGIGQAFVLAGADAVIASTRPVDDAAALRWMEALYDAGFQAGSPPEAFQRAMTAAAEQGLDRSVAGFRLLTP